MGLKLLVITSDTAFQKHFTIYKIFMQYNIVLSSYKFNHSISLTPRSRIGGEMKKILIVIHFFHNRYTALGEISPAPNVLIIKIFFFRHEILQYLFKFLFTDSQGGCICIAI